MRLRAGAPRRGDEVRLSAGAAELNALIDDAYDAVVMTTLDGAITYWNKAAERLYGRGGGIAHGVDIRDVVPEVVRPKIDRVLQAVGEGQVVPPARRSHTYASGVMAVAEVVATPVRDDDDEVTAVGFFVRYAVEGMEPTDELAIEASEALHSGLMSARRSLLQSEARYRAIIETAEQGIALIDAGGSFVFANARMAEFLGVDADRLPGRTAYALLGDPNRLVQVHQSGRSQRYELFHVHPTGQTLCGLVTVTAVDDDEFGPGTALLMVSDITDLKRAQEERERLAVLDPLTELANASLFHDRVERAVRLAPDGTSAGVLVADIDRFRDVNDAFGTNVADQLLRTIGSRISDVCPADATVARIVGDQFAVFVEDTDGPGQLMAFADLIHEAVAAPVFVGALELVPSVSIGIAQTLAGSDARTVRAIGSARSHVAEDVLRRAHAAMRVARAGGPGHTAVDDVRVVDTVAARLALIPELRRAIHEDQLELRFQPAVDLETGVATSVEALVRWRHPARGLLEPTDFISVAEDSGLVVDLGAWVLERAARVAREWHAAGVMIPVAVNVSGRQLTEEHFVEQVRSVLGRTGIDPRLVVLEVTESVFVEDRTALVTRLRALRRIGCRVAIDDFGTGYSSLAQLGHLPLDVLKIDQQFVRDVAATPRAEALVRSIVEVAAVFGLDVVAEGVETDDQRRALLRLGCPSAQGFLWADPMSREDLLLWFADTARSLPV